MKRYYIFISIVMGMELFLLTGCQDRSAGRQEGHVAISDADGAAGGAPAPETDLSEENGGNAEEEAGQEERNREEDAEGEEKAEQGEAESEPDDMPKEAPPLPETGGQLADFVPEGWEVWDSVELDFNKDDIPDYVGVLQAVMTGEDGYQVYRLEYPRILFAIASEGKEGYRLDFQDMNIIRARDEGGIYGDPYLPLTAEGTSFTTHTYGGSAWRWSEDYTYTYREGTWWLSSSEETYGYGDYITDYERNDWESGVGIRKERSSDWGPMEENFALVENADWDSIGYDLEYDVPLDEQMTLEQAGKRWWLAPDRVTDWEVKKMVFAADVDIPEGRVEQPGEAYIEYCDENCALYTFGVDSDPDRSIRCLAMYDWQGKVLSVLAQGESPIESPKFYDGKIYYTSEIVENVTYRTMEDGKEHMTEEEETVGVRLNRMEPDGTGKEVIFEYRYLETVPEIMEKRVPYLSLLYEISGGEVVAEVYLGDGAHPFYRMKTDGSGQEKIGQVPK